MTARLSPLLASLLVATGFAISAPAALARPAEPPCMSADGASMMQRHDQHRQRLHDALKLTPEQEPAWQKFQAAHQPIGPSERPDRTALDKMTAPERADAMLAFAKKHQERMEQHVAALKAFYNQLTPEQQKVFDAHKMQRPERRQSPRGPGAGAGPQQPPAR